MFCPHKLNRIKLLQTNFNSSERKEARSNLRMHNLCTIYRHIKSYTLPRNFRSSLIKRDQTSSHFPNSLQLFPPKNYLPKDRTKSKIRENLAHDLANIPSNIIKPLPRPDSRISPPISFAGSGAKDRAR